MRNYSENEDSVGKIIALYIALNALSIVLKKTGVNSRTHLHRPGSASEVTLFSRDATLDCCDLS